MVSTLVSCRIFGSSGEHAHAARLRIPTVASIQRRGDIVAVLPRLGLAAVDVVVAHASAKSYAAEAAKTAGWTAARAERTKRTRFRKDVPDHAAFRFVPFAVETCGYMGKEAVKFVMYRRSGLVISREQGLRYDAGFAVPVLMS